MKSIGEPESSHIFPEGRGLPLGECSFNRSNPLPISDSAESNQWDASELLQSIALCINRKVLP
jgi:hypothetical protein